MGGFSFSFLGMGGSVNFHNPSMSDDGAVDVLGWTTVVVSLSLLISSNHLRRYMYAAWAIQSPLIAIAVAMFATSMYTEGANKSAGMAEAPPHC